LFHKKNCLNVGVVAEWSAHLKTNSEDNYKNKTYVNAKVTAFMNTTSTFMFFILLGRLRAIFHTSVNTSDAICTT